MDHNCHNKLEKPFKKHTNNVILYNKTFNTTQEKKKNPPTNYKRWNS